MKKALVIGVIILFLSVGFQPALANEVSITQTSNAEEDCECQEVNRVDLLRVKLLLIRLEAFTNIILSKFGHIPEIVTICKEILEILKNGIKDIICNIILNPLWKLADLFFELALNSTTNLELLIYGFLFIFFDFALVIIGIALNCENWEPPCKQLSSIILGRTLNQNWNNFVESPSIQV